ncbi:MAG: hypothetical protein RMI56_03975 [Sulfolobales archaeon]|nr:hypothetical protein [Sulfolobales archaeon]MDW8082941.1 hypothetical protein [Sulfolobales archaeon]
MHSEAVRLLRQLVEDYSSFFDSSGYLNSEGRKVFESAARSLVKNCRWLKKSVTKTRKKATYENVVKLLEIVLKTCTSL